MCCADNLFTSIPKSIQFMMLMKLTPKIKETVWDPKLEKLIREKWGKEKSHQFNFKTKKKVFVIDTPPPYPRSN